MRGSIVVSSDALRASSETGSALFSCAAQARGEGVRVGMGVWGLGFGVWGLGIWVGGFLQLQ